MLGTTVANGNSRVRPVAPRYIRRTTTTRRSRRSERTIPFLLCWLALLTMGFHTTLVAGWTLSDWIYGAAAGAVVATLLSRRSSQLAPLYARKAPPAVLIASFVLLSAGTVSSFWAVNSAASMTIVARLAWLTLGWFWVFRSVVTSRERLADLIVAFRVTVLINSFVAIAGYTGIWTRPSPEGKDFYDRQFAFYGHPNNLAELLSLGAVFFLFDLSLRERGEPRRFLDRPPVRMTCFAIVAFAIATTGSMTGAGALIGGSATALLVRSIAQNRGRRTTHLTILKRMSVALVALLAVVWLFQSGSSLVERFSGLVSGTDKYTAGSVESRGEFSTFVIDQVDDLLVIGVGLDDDTTDVVSGDLMGANHNMPLKILLQAGLPALAALVVLNLLFLRMAWTLIVSTRGTPLQLLAVTLLAGVVCVNIQAQSQPMTYEREYWLSGALIGALWSLRKVELIAAKKRNAPAPDRDPAPAGTG